MAGILGQGIGTVHGQSVGGLLPITPFPFGPPKLGDADGNITFDAFGKTVTITPLGQAVLIEYGLIWLVAPVTAWFATKTAFFVAVPTTVAEWLGFKGFTFVFKLLFHEDFHEVLDEWFLHYFFSIKGQQEITGWILSGKDILDFPWEKLRGSIGADP